MNIGAIIQTLVAAFVIGGLARWAVPGPDPMPIWMTTFFGFTGAVIGNGIAWAAFGTELDAGTAFAAWLLSILAATLIVIAYRRFVEHRPITGPGAKQPPQRRVTGLGDVFGRGKPDEDVDGQIRKLAELRDEGVLSDEEFQAKRAELLERQ